MMRMSRGTFPCMGLRAMGLRKRGTLASLICPRNQTLGLCIAILACLTGFSMTCRASTRFEGMAIEPGISIKGISVPIGSLQSKSPALTMKVGEIALEPSRIGIFRTPLVPSVVFKDVTLILHPATGGSSWGMLFRHLLRIIVRWAMPSSADLKCVQRTSNHALRPSRADFRRPRKPLC